MKTLTTLIFVTCAMLAAMVAAPADAGGRRVQFVQVQDHHCGSLSVQRFSSRPRFVQQQVIVRDRVRFVDSGRRVNQIGLLNLNFR